MKKANRIIALVLVLVIALSVVGCAENSKPLSEEDIIKKNVVDFAAALSQLDFAKARTLLSEDSDILEDFEFDGLVDDATDSYGEVLEAFGISETEAANLITQIIKPIFAKVSVSIKSVTIEEGVYAEVLTEMTLPDFDSLENVLYNIDLEGQFMDRFGNGFDINSANAKTEFINWIVSVFSSVDYPVEAYELYFSLEKINGQWLITYMDD